MKIIAALSFRLRVDICEKLNECYVLYRTDLSKIVKKMQNLLLLFIRIFTVFFMNEIKVHALLFYIDIENSVVQSYTLTTLPFTLKGHWTIF